MKDLEIDVDNIMVEKELSQFSTEILEIWNHDIDEEKERFIIELEEPLKKNDKIQILLNYRKYTPPGHSDVALVRYSYRQNPGGEKKWLAVSKSGAINARRLYPCIDEVDLKAKVTVKIVHDENVINLSNTDIISSNEKNSNNDEVVMVDTYRKTDYLSTFSVGFVVGDFKLKEVTDNELSRNKIRIWADEAVIDQIYFATNTALFILQFYQTYFLSVLDTPEIDIVALPNYGLIDKWRYGLITLEETLLTTENPSSEVRRIEIALQLCDVFCHQYFGPQTTLSKWSENWLNMGFALFFRIPCLENIFSEIETSLLNIQSIVNIHLVESFIRVLAVEAEIKSHPVMLPDSRINLTDLFNHSMVAERAYFLVRMMSSFLSQNILQEGVQNILLQFRFKITNLEEMWNSFPLKPEHSKSLPSNTTLKTIMDSWIFKKGHAHIKMTREKNDEFVTIKQELPDADIDGTINYRIIPLNFATKSGSETKSNQKGAESGLGENSNEKGAVQYWLRSEPIQIPVPKKDWIILDSSLDVLCRIEYDSITLELLEKTLLDKRKYETIDVMARTHFISDLFASAEVGKISYAIVFRIMKYLKHEKSHLPMAVALHEFNKIRPALFGTPAFKSFQNYVEKILKPIFKRKTFSNIGELPQNDYGEYYFKKSIISSACIFEIRSCVNQSVALFNKWLTESEDQSEKEKMNPIPEALRETVYCQAIKKGDYHNKEWNLLWTMRENPQNFNIILNALACTMDTKKLLLFLEWCINRKVDPKIRIAAFKSVASNRNAFNILTYFLQQRIVRIIELNKNDISQVYSYLEIIYEVTWTEEDLSLLNEFTESVVKKLKITETHVSESIETHLKKSKQIAEKNILWLSNNAEKFSNFLKGKESTKKARKIKLFGTAK